MSLTKYAQNIEIALIEFPNDIGHIIHVDGEKWIEIGTHRFDNPLYFDGLQELEREGIIKMETSDKFCFIDTNS